MLSCPAGVLLAQELAQLLPAAANADHDVAPEDSNKYDELIAHFVFAVPDPDHGELRRTGALA